MESQVNWEAATFFATVVIGIIAYKHYCVEHAKATSSNPEEVSHKLKVGDVRFSLFVLALLCSARAGVPFYLPAKPIAPGQHNKEPSRHVSLPNEAIPVAAESKTTGEHGEVRQRDSETEESVGHGKLPDWGTPESWDWGTSKKLG